MWYSTMTMAGVLLAATTSPVYAELYQCKNPDQSTEYQTERCASPETRQTLVIERSPGGVEGALSRLESMTTADIRREWMNNIRFGEWLIHERTYASKPLGPTTKELDNACIAQYRGVFADPRSLYIIGAARWLYRGKEWISLEVVGTNVSGVAVHGNLACDPKIGLSD